LKSMQNIAVVVPNWNGKDKLKDCLDSLRAQTRKHQIIVVENGSIDGSLEYLQKNCLDVNIVINQKNLGFAGGVNSGIREAMEQGCQYVALFNNDALAEPKWLENLAQCLDANESAGIATCKLLTSNGQQLDSTGDYYTVWGLPYPRGRGETETCKYDRQPDVFGASGGASLYRIKMLEQIGLFDEDFFAYYEDVDLSFRAQLAGWKVRYVPEAVVYHQISGTTSQIRGFATYQTLKNLPTLLVKNVPRQYFYKVAWRFLLAETLFFARAILRGHIWAAVKGKIVGVCRLPSAFKKRKQIQAAKTVSDEYIWSVMVHDLPPNAHNLRRLRSLGRRLRGKAA
jgi:GT2 family glycosyltransferase